MDVGEDKARDLHQGDDEGAFGHVAQVLVGQLHHRGWGQGQLRCIPDVHHRVQVKRSLK